MCGLVGYFTNFFGEKDKDAVIDLMLVSQVRGIDSTGMIKLHQSNDNKTVDYTFDKDAVPSSTFLYERYNDLFVPKAGHKLYGFIGHVRAATKGKVEKKNAHPFKNNKVVGVHNGTIHGSFDNWHKYDTDSEAIYYNIAEMGVEKGLQAVNKANKSAYALIWYDHDKGKIHFIRNSERPLWLAHSKSQHAYILASEKPFLKYVEDKYNLDYDRLILLQEDVLYTLSKTVEPGFNFDEKKIKAKLPPPPPVVSNYSNYNSGGAYNPVNWVSPAINQTAPWVPPGTDAIEAVKKQIQDVRHVGNVVTFPAKEKLKASQKSLFENDTIPFELRGKKEKIKEDEKEVVHAPFLTLNKHDWDARVASGCLHCQQVPHYSTRGKMHWVDDDNYYCSDCTSNPELTLIIHGQIGHC
jgi:asparagine synthetase B (glutamine-hydrolysing)